jgi:HPt (histidine-containing phosphotransfer) domain-containing protein
MKRQHSQSEKIRVHVDPDLRDLIPDYLKNRGKDLLVYRQALEEGDFNSIVILGHSMKGSGGGYGFNELSNIGRALENAAKNRDKESIRQAITDFAEFLHKLEVVYD